MYIPKTKERLQVLLQDESISLRDIDTSFINDMSGLFKDTKRTDFTGIELWDTSSVRTMNCMFVNAYKFNADISKWDVSNVRDMHCMFYKAYEFNADLSQWDTSNVKDMAFMFYFARKFNSDISSVGCFKCKIYV